MQCRYTVAGTVWAFHPTSLVALMGTCDGPTRRRRVELAIADVQRTVVTRRQTYARPWTCVKFGPRMNADKRGSEDCIECAVVRGVIPNSKRAIVSYGTRGAEKRAECATCETAAYADSLCSDRRHVIQR